jgi:hypothetical protein
MNNRSCAQSSARPAGYFNTIFGSTIGNAAAGEDEDRCNVGTESSGIFDADSDLRDAFAAARAAAEFHAFASEIDAAAVAGVDGVGVHAGAGTGI